MPRNCQNAVATITFCCQKLGGKYLWAGVDGGSSSFSYSLLSLPRGSEVAVTIQYSTSPSCSAVQWLEPVQTAGKQHPYLFTQCQVRPRRNSIGSMSAKGSSGKMTSLSTRHIFIPSLSVTIWTEYVNFITTQNISIDTC